MQESIDIFRYCMKRAEDLHDLHASLGSETPSKSVRASDILRAEIVMAVSAFDLFNHELIRLGMLECFDGSRRKTGKYHDFTRDAAIADHMSRKEFSDRIRESHKRVSFQGPESVVRGIRLFHEFGKGEGGLWESVADKMNASTDNTKSHLNLIVKRRNEIVHEADIQTNSEEPWPIKREYVESSFRHVNGIAEAIYEIVTQ